MAMEVKDYCSNVNAELTGWKAKLYDYLRKMEQLPTGDKEKVFKHIGELNILVSDLEERINELQTQCPTEWNPKREEINSKMDDLNKRWKDAQNVLFDYDFGG